jgi:hypothetical protein
MITRRRSYIVLLVVTVAIAIAIATPATAGRKENPSLMRATGTFDVNLAPQALADMAADKMLGRMRIDKTYRGELEGAASGEMLTALTSIKDSAGYVAIERVSGTLHGRKGAFVLQHTGTMNRGAQSLSVTVVPDSGTGDLAGLSGKMDIKIDQGKHSYEFAYTITTTP